MVLLRLEGDENNTRVVLRDPNAAEDALLIIDRPRFEDVWSGDIVLVSATTKSRMRRSRSVLASSRHCCFASVASRVTS